MFTIDDAIRQSNQPLFFILTRICRLLRNQRWATRTENLSIQTIVILPSFFFWFFLDDDAPYRAVRMMRGGHHTNKLHRLYMGRDWYLFTGPHPSRRRQGPGGKRGTFYRLLGGNSSGYVHTYVDALPRPPCTDRRFIVLAAFLFAYSFWSGSPFQYIGDRISLSSPVLVSIRLTYSLSMIDTPYCSHL